MGRPGFIFRNLMRHKARTFMTGFSVFLAFVLFGLLLALKQAFSFGVDLAGADRLITIHKVSLVQLLPIAYRYPIEQVEGVEVAAHFTWFGGYYREPNNQLPVFPTEIDSFLQIYSEFSIPPEQLAVWRGNRTGLLVGKTMADSFSWKVGDRISLASNIFENINGGNSWEFTIDGIFRGAGNGVDEFQAYMHYDYFNESRTFARDEVGWFLVKISDPADADQVAKSIDQIFANSPNETKTTTEKGFVQAFASQVGNIGKIVTFIMAIVLFSSLLVTGNAIAHGVSERTAEIAVLKAMGYTDLQALRLILSENLLLTLLFGGLGLLFAVVLTGALRFMLAKYLPGLALSGVQLLFALAVLLALGLISGLVPAYRAMALDVAEALSRR